MITRSLLSVLLLLVPALLFSQTNSGIFVIDFVQIIEERRKETIFYFENNWKLYRDTAVARDIIKSYSLLTTKRDAASDFDLILITEFADSLQYKVHEDRFQEIIKELRPHGPILLNEWKPVDFRKSVLLKEAEVLFGSNK